MIDTHTHAISAISACFAVNTSPQFRPRVLAGGSDDPLEPGPTGLFLVGLWLLRDIALRQQEAFRCVPHLLDRDIAFCFVSLYDNGFLLFVMLKRV